MLQRTRSGAVIAFIERYCRAPEGALVGKPIRLLEFQKAFLRAIYDNPAGTRRAYLSIARKNAKSALTAMLVLAHLVGPERRPNSQIVSGARSRDQAALVFHLAEKMVLLSPQLQAVVRIIPSLKRLVGVPGNVEYRALSAEAGTAHGLSPALAILDEVGQIHGPTDAFTLVNGSVGAKWGEKRNIVTMLKVTNLLNQEIQQHIFGDITKLQMVAELRVGF